MAEVERVRRVDELGRISVGAKHTNGFFVVIEQDANTIVLRRVTMIPIVSLDNGAQRVLGQKECLP